MFLPSSRDLVADALMQGAPIPGREADRPPRAERRAGGVHGITGGQGRQEHRAGDNGEGGGLFTGP